MRGKVRCSVAGWASMGPRSEERGDLTSGDGIGGRCAASMGPRSEERGDIHRLAVGDVLPLASMGPRSEERGDVRRGSGKGGGDRLQWGRALRSAEMRKKIARLRKLEARFNGAAL